MTSDALLPLSVDSNERARGLRHHSPKLETFPLESLSETSGFYGREIQM